MPLETRDNLYYLKTFMEASENVFKTFECVGQLLSGRDILEEKLRQQNRSVISADMDDMLRINNYRVLRVLYYINTRPFSQDLYLDDDSDKPTNDAIALVNFFANEDVKEY
jgi:hypothetical protein